jgi:hypothetical protein
VPGRSLLIEINHQFRIIGNDVRIPINDISDIYIKARVAVFVCGAISTPGNLAGNIGWHCAGALPK